MTRSIYLIGPPGAGKTTLLAAYTRRLNTHPAVRLWGQLWAEPLTQATRLIGLRLGKTRGAFSGTDALGMAVNPHAVHWAETGDFPALIVGEGQRLANLAFLTALHENSRLAVAHITADNAPQRRAARADALNRAQQTPTFVKAATTRAANLTQALKERGITVLHINTTHLTPIEGADMLTRLTQDTHRRDMPA